MLDSTLRTQSEKSIVKPSFPTWKTIIRKLGKLHASSIGIAFPTILDKLESNLHLVERLKAELISRGNNFHPAIAYDLMCHGCCIPPTKDHTEDNLRIVQNLHYQSNTFYTLFDTDKRELVGTDPRIREILGIEPDQFSLKGLLGFDQQNQLFHPQDMPHSVRWAALVFLVLSIPGLEIRALEDHYRARFRVGVSMSKLESIRNLGYVTLEKSGYALKARNFNDPLPSQFLYKISVFTEDDFHGINPYFVSDPNRSIYMNAFHYLFHAYLMGIGTKYLLLLDERSRIDRNKMIANSINEKISAHGKRRVYLDEGQVADCFAKTIRPKLSDGANIWENRTEKLVITSDQEAVDYSRTMGLLPMPKKVSELIYQSIA